ncbi:hypothetical protein M885DRAFT_489519, partial [Pelagophyceae sp. CCMP2097]
FAEDEGGSFIIGAELYGARRLRVRASKSCRPTAGSPLRCVPHGGTHPLTDGCRPEDDRRAHHLVLHLRRRRRNRVNQRPPRRHLRLGRRRQLSARVGPRAPRRAPRRRAADHRRRRAAPRRRARRAPEAAKAALWRGTLRGERAAIASAAAAA